MAFEPIMQQVEHYAIQFLAQGRKDWDIPHTRSVVYYAETIARSVKQDLLVLKTAAWLHDVGYAGLFEDGSSNRHAAVRARKALHMIEGARLAKAFLDRPEIALSYQPWQRQRIIHLVSVHDRVHDLTDLDELVLMEADTLGAMDITRVTPTYDYENGMRYIQGLKYGRLLKFTTELGIHYAEKLLPRLETHILSKSPTS